MEMREVKIRWFKINEGVIESPEFNKYFNESWQTESMDQGKMQRSMWNKESSIYVSTSEENLSESTSAEILSTYLHVRGAETSGRSFC